MTMTTPENSPDSLPTIESLQQACHSLRTTLHAVILSVLVLGLSLNIFIWREGVTLRRQIESGPKKFVMDYEHNSVPVMNELSARLQDFARSNADFVPILAKYGSTNAPAAPPSRVPAIPKK